jgi:hypothetical protein
VGFGAGGGTRGADEQWSDDGKCCCGDNMANAVAMEGQETTTRDDLKTKVEKKMVKKTTQTGLEPLHHVRTPPHILSHTEELTQSLPYPGYDTLLPETLGTISTHVVYISKGDHLRNALPLGHQADFGI